MSAGLVSGVFALMFGLQHSYGGAGQAVATGVFGTWFLGLPDPGVAGRSGAIRCGDVVNLRRWMIRDFAIGVAVGTIRIWIGILLGAEVLSE